MSKRFLPTKTKNRTVSIVVCAAILLMLTSVFSINAQESSPEPPQKQTQNGVDDLNYHLSSDQLSIIPISINGQQIEVPAIKYSARQAIVKGVTILIGEIQAQGQVDSTLNALAKSLPDWGWHTILITPTQAYLALKPPEAETESKATNENTEAGNVDENANTSSLSGDNQPALFPQVDLKSNTLQAPVLEYTHSDYLMFIKALTQGINTRFAQQPGYQVIYANGKSASALIALLSLPESPQIDALIVNNTYWPSTELNRLLPQQLANLPMPVLDLISMSDNSWAKQTSQARATASKVNLKPMYRQREIIGGALSLNQQDYLAKEVVGWTYFLGW
ncbi:MAG: hypothetical protein ACJAVV_001885 [Alphaproteobacteria bacterium]|jgi:hypothetical protein